MGWQFLMSEVPLYHAAIENEGSCPESPIPKPETLNTKPETGNPKPQTATLMEFPDDMASRQLITMGGVSEVDDYNTGEPRS